MFAALFFFAAATQEGRRALLVLLKSLFLRRPVAHFFFPLGFVYLELFEIFLPLEHFLGGKIDLLLG